MKFKTIKECAVYFICTEGDILTNKQIAEKVRKEMDSLTTDKSIAWYKNKINRGVIKIDKAKCKWFNKNDSVRVKESVVENLDEELFSNEAERFVFEKEKIRTGKIPKKMKNNDGHGYDIDSGDRHIEVKHCKKKNKSGLLLTSKETETLLKDPLFYLYLVEGDVENEPENVELYMIPKTDILAMAQLKIHARLTRLSNRENRKQWLISK
jgi:hypothetical protein